MNGIRRGLAAISMIAIAGLTMAAAPVHSERFRAYLDGREIPAAEISSYFCHDLERPTIRCYRTSALYDAGAKANGTASLLAAVVYVTIYDGQTYSGSFLQVSSDYDVLAGVGWNDRVSSYKARNSETGSFYQDWFHGGSGTAFCCNMTVPGLGGLDNTFSSVYRT
jgi:hypothetical protein